MILATALVLLLASGSRLPLPQDVSDAIARQYPSWQLAEATEYRLSLVPPGHDPRWCTGDFDGDGERDIAVLLELRSNPPKRIVVVVFRRSDGVHVMYAGPGADFVATFLRGTSDHDYDTDSDFTYQLDSIFCGVDECCGESLTFVRGRFIRRTTSD